MPLLDSFEKRRKYPRVVIDSPVTIAGEDGVSLQGVVRDISPDGVKIVCDARTAAVIYPHPMPFKPTLAKILNLSFTLPFAAGQKPIAVRTRLVYMVDLSPDFVAFGAQFHGIEPETEGLIQRFFIECLEPTPEEVASVLRSAKEGMARAGIAVSELDDLEKSVAREAAKHELAARQAGIVSDQPLSLSEEIREIRAGFMKMNQLLGLILQKMNDIDRLLSVKMHNIEGEK